MRLDKLDDEICIRLDKGMGANYISMFEMFSAWKEQAEKLKNGEITKEEYDRWRYRYPEFDTTQRWAKVPSQELSDMQVDELK